MKRRIYIAGPMRGMPEHNFPAFNRAAEQLRADGWIVCSPVDVGRLFANDPNIHGSEYLREDLLHLVRCSAIALLPGWERSVGARCEVAVAITLGLEFLWNAASEDAPYWATMPRPVSVRIAGGYERLPGAPESLDDLREEVNEWQRVTFTRRTLHSIATHLLREAQELHRDPSDLEEAADVFMLLVGLTDGRDLAGAVRAKLEKNKARAWGTPDADGVVEHIAEGAA